jgi:hypothetical protein
MARKTGKMRRFRHVFSAAATLNQKMDLGLLMLKMKSDQIRRLTSIFA